MVQKFFLTKHLLAMDQDVCLKTSKNYTDYCSFTKHLHAMDQEVCLVTFKNYTDLWFHIAMEEVSRRILAAGNSICKGAPAVMCMAESI